MMKWYVVPAKSCTWCFLEYFDAMNEKHCIDSLPNGPEKGHLTGRIWTEANNLAIGKCVTFDGDDGPFYICERHLREMLDALVRDEAL